MSEALPHIEAPKAAEDAAHLAGHPEHMGRSIVASAIGSSIAGVGAYQANTAIAKHQHKAGPSLTGSSNVHITVTAPKGSHVAKKKTGGR